MVYVVLSHDLITGWTAEIYEAREAAHKAAHTLAFTSDDVRIIEGRTIAAIKTTHGISQPRRT